jgi:hypothetical protein
VQSTAILAGLVVIGCPALYAGTFARVAAAVASIQRPTLNARDTALQHKGYYEKLDNESRMSAQLWDVTSQKPVRWAGLRRTSAYRPRADFLLGDLMPGASTQFGGQPLSVNRWGMRGGDIRLAKSPGTYRIAILGPSTVMGSGVADGETFPDLLEQRLNATARGPLRYEVLNLGVVSYSLLEQLAMLEDRVFQFQPDVVIVSDTATPQMRVVMHLLSVVAAGIPIPFPELQQLVRDVGIEAVGHQGIPVPFDWLRSITSELGVATRMPWTEAVRRLHSSCDRVVSWTLRAMAERIRAHDAVPVFVALDLVGDAVANEPRVILDARAAGFVIFDLLRIWQGRDYNAFRLSDWDSHANAAGNRLIAERLFELIQSHNRDLRAPSTSIDVVAQDLPRPGGADSHGGRH